MAFGFGKLDHEAPGGLLQGPTALKGKEAAAAAAAAEQPPWSTALTQSTVHPESEHQWEGLEKKEKEEEGIPPWERGYP